MNDHPSDGPTQPVGVTRCQACGTPRFHSIAACRYCERRQSVELPVQFRFGIGSLMLLTTLVAVLLGITVMVPGLGILLAIFSVPAYVRAWSGVARRQACGKSVDASIKVLAFMNSLGRVLLIVISPCFVFLVTCALPVIFIADIVVAVLGDAYGVVAGLKVLLVTIMGIVSVTLPIHFGVLVGRELWPHRD